MNLEQSNIINQEKIINTRKEFWNSLFCWIDFSKTKWKNKVYNKEQQFLQMPQTFVDWQKETASLLIEKHSEIEELISKFEPYFKKEVYPVLGEKEDWKKQLIIAKKKQTGEIPLESWENREGLENYIKELEQKIKAEGDPTLLFRCKRLLENKMIGETSSLFPDALSNNSGDLVIFEIEYRQQQKFKEFLQRLTSILFNDERVNNLWIVDLEKLQNGRINYSLAQTFWFKWSDKIENRELVNEINEYLKLWQYGKGATSQWKNKLKDFAVKIDELFTKKQGENCFFQLGFIKKQAKWKEGLIKEVDGLIISTQNRKGWELLNPYLMLFWFHQKPASNNALAYRAYFVNNFNMTNPRNLYVTLDLREDWIWKNYGRALLSPGTLKSENHPIYHERNLPTTLTDKKLHYPFCEDLGQKKIFHLTIPDQPKWSLYTLNHPHFIEKLSDMLIKDVLDGSIFGLSGDGALFGESGKDIKLPENIYKIDKYNSWTTGFWKSGVTLFLAPSDYFEGKTFIGVSNKKSKWSYQTDPTEKTIILPEDLSNLLENQEHLNDHSTFQFLFLHEVVCPANLRYMDIRKEDNKWVIKYVEKIKATPAGTRYFCVSKNIFWEVNLEVKQTVPSAGNLKALLTGAAVVATVSAFASMGSLGAAEGGTDLAKSTGIKKIAKETKTKSKEKKFKKEKSLLPEEAEEITFSFSLFDFWSKINRKEVFWARIYTSENLYNNLQHNNNQNPITFPLNITFDKLWKVIKKGEYQGELKLLGHDPGSYLSNKFKEGIIFFEDRIKDFITPELGIKNLREVISYGLTNTGAYTSEEIREEEVVEVDRKKGSNYHQRVHYLIEYEDGTKEHWLGLLPMFTDSELADGHTKGAFNLYFDKAVKYFWDVYTCIGCGASNQFSDLHADYGYGSHAHGKTMPTDSWDNLYKDLPVEPWLDDVEDVFHLRWCGRNMGSLDDVWDGRKEQRPNKKPFTAAYGFIPQKGVIRWRLGSTGVKIQEIPQQNDFTGLDWQPNPETTGDIGITPSAFNFGEGDILDTPDIPENEPDLPDIGGGEPEITIEPDISIEPDVPEDDDDEFPEPDIPEPEITPPEPDIPEPEITPPEPDIPEPEITPPEPEHPEGDVPEGDAGDTDPPDPDEFPDSGEGD